MKNLFEPGDWDKNAALDLLRRHTEMTAEEVIAFLLPVGIENPKGG